MLRRSRPAVFPSTAFAVCAPLPLLPWRRQQRKRLYAAADSLFETAVHSRLYEGVFAAGYRLNPPRLALTVDENAPQPQLPFLRIDGFEISVERLARPQIRL